jgi:hypothetical protein
MTLKHQSMSPLPPGWWECHLCGRTNYSESSTRSGSTAALGGCESIEVEYNKDPSSTQTSYDSRDNSRTDDEKGVSFHHNTEDSATDTVATLDTNTNTSSGSIGEGRIIACIDKCRTCHRPATWRQPQSRPLFGKAILRPLHTLEKSVLADDEVNQSSPDDGLTPLHVACIRGDLPSVRALLARGAFVEAQSRQGWRPLHFAAYRGHAHVAEELLLRSEPPAEAECATSQQYLKPLHLAVGAGSAHLVLILLRHMQVEPSPCDITGRTPLHMAADLGHTGCGHLLLQYMCDVEARDHDGWQPRQVRNHFLPLMTSIFFKC